MIWLRYWPQLVVFLIAYGVEVQVKAESSHYHSQLISEPAGCHHSQVNGCLLATALTATGPVKLELGSFVLGMDRGAKLRIDTVEQQGGAGESSSLIQIRLLQIRLLEGAILVASLESDEESSQFSKVQLVSEYGLVEMGTGEEVILSRNGQAWVELRVLKGQAELHPKGDDFVWKVPEGFALSYGPVNDRGLAQVNMPQPLNIKDSLRRWSGLHGFDMQTWRAKVQKAVPVWLEAVEASARWQKDQVERRIAAVESERLDQKQRELRIQRENEELRRLFREKNYLDW